jgi:hypothetical protein
LNYALSTGQTAFKIPLYQRFFGAGQTPPPIIFDQAGGVPRFAQGGTVWGNRRAADSVLGLLTPGEEVLSPAEAAAYRSGKKGGISLSPVINLTVKIDRDGVKDVLTEGVYQAVQKLPRIVVDAVNSALGGDYGRRSISNKLAGLKI